MTHIRSIISSLFLLIFSVSIIHGQQNCDFDMDSVIERVTNVCSDVAPNEVCYGNRDVTAFPRLNVNFNFTQPGDTAPLTNIQSLVVDAFNATEDTWGVAQMRLEVGSETGTQDVTMLLFGTFEIANAVARADEVNVVTRSTIVNVYSEPDESSELMGDVASGITLVAVARSEDSTWLRIRTNDIGGFVGWILASSVGVAQDETDTIDELEVHQADTPYFGAMQAFYFQSGDSNIGCDSLQSDGLLIQTPEGEARISLLINEVSIELLSSSSGSEDGTGTAIIQANPNSENGMSINVIEGEATIQTDQGEQTIQEGQQSTIPITVNLDVNGRLSEIFPSGEASEPTDFDFSDLDLSPLLGAVNDSDSGDDDESPTMTVTAPPDDGGGDDDDNNNSDDDGSSSSSSSGGFSIRPSPTDSSGGSGSSSSGNSSSGNDTGSSSSGNGPGIGIGDSENNTMFDNFSEQANTFFLGIAITSGVILLAIIIVLTIRRNRSEKAK